MAYYSTAPCIHDITLPGPKLSDWCGASATIVFMSFLEQLIRSSDKISGKCNRVFPIETPDEEYDFVVIGGGAAGATVAARLSENSNWKVLLVEAGTDEPASSNVPAFAGAFVESMVDWNFTTANESYACLATDGSCVISIGKMLGGGTGRNGMIYNRGVPSDFDNWATQGNDGWAWNDVLPYYLKAEDNREIERVGRTYHSIGGPVSVERYPYIPSFGYAVLAASMEKGYNISEDLNGKEITGFTIAQTMTKNGVRCSSATAYLRPARNRKNLYVSLESHATKLLIKHDQAVGVEYYQGGKLKRVRVAREIIVSAGVIGSPQLLLLSGIGPKAHLEAVKVDVVKDLPGTGENFHDHTRFALSFTIDDTDQYDIDWSNVAQYFVDQTGPLSGAGLGPLMATLATKSATSESPDLQFQFSGYVAYCAPGDVGGLRSTGKRPIGVNIINLRPESRGRISLSSNNPFESPIIWGNYLSKSSEIDILISGIEVSLELLDTQALRAYNLTLSTTPIEACSDHTFRSTEYWTCVIRQFASISNWHAVGTCKMGPASDSMAVVDTRLRVHGIKGIRVADASIMPQVTSGNTAAPAIMIGERAADFIKKDWGHY